MSKVEMSETWQTPKSQEQVEEIVRRFAAQNKMKLADGEAAGINLEGGSQVAMRLLGGWFVKPTMLPKRASVNISPTAQGSTVAAEIKDTLGVGVMDPKLRAKYESYCEAWIAGLGKELEA